MNRLRVGLTGLVLAAVLAGGFFFWGRFVFDLPVMQALTPPDDAVPYVLMVGRGEDLPSPNLVRSLMGMVKPADPLPAETGPFLSFLRRMNRFALSVTPEPAGPRFCGAFYPVGDDLKELRRGELPRFWVEQGVLTPVGRGEEGTWPVRFVGTQDLMLRLHGRMLLLAGTASDLELMERNLESTATSAEPVWKVRPDWSTHLRVHEAGVLGDVLFMGGIDVGERILSAEMAWRKGKSARDLAWKVDGVDDLVSAWGFSARGMNPLWRRSLTMPSPILLTLGIDFPEPFLRRFGVGPERDWTSGPGLSVPWKESLTAGPLVLSLAGSSRLFLFSAPGAYFQLLDRGENGRVMVDRLWQEKWASMKDRRSPIGGFSSGGGVSRPFSLVGAAGEDRLIVGFLSPSQAADTRTPAAFLPFDPSGCSLWFHADLPGLASAVERWAQLAEYARSFGFELSGAERLFARTELLRSLGKLSLALKTPFEGWVSWTGGEDLLP